MTDDRTTQAPLSEELTQLRQRVAELEASQAEYQHIAAALRDSQERYRDLFENANDLIQSVSPDGHYLYVNRTWHETLGYSASELEAMTIFDIIAPECQAACRLTFQRVMAGERPDRVETTLLAKDGRRILLEGSVNCQVVNGHPVATRGIFRNITARKRAEARLARLNECFLGFGPDPLGNINQITMTCGELLQADVALYNRLDAGLLCAWGQWRTPDDFQAVDRPEGHICFDVINRGTDDVVLIRDLLHSSYAQTDPNVSHYGLQTYLGRAVKFNGVAVGSLCLVYGRDYQPDVDDQHLLGVMAAAIGVEEQRRQAEQRLKERDVQLTQAATLAKVAYWEFDYPSARFVFNDQFYAIIHTSAEKAGGYTMPVAQYLTQFVHPDDRARLQAQIEAERDAAPGLGRAEYRTVDGNGDIQHVLVEYRLILNDQQRPFKVYGAHLDITELKRVEEARARYAQHMAALYATSLEVNAQPDLPSLLKSIVERAADLLKASMAGLYLVNPDNETLTLVVNLNITSVELGIQLRFGEGVAGRVAQSGQPLMIDNYRAWEGRSPAFTNPEFTRVLGVPLKSGQRVIGVIDIDDPQPGVFSAEDVRLVSLFADQAAIAIEKARLLQEVVTTADRRTVLYRAIQAIGASVDREQICLAIHQAVAQVMPAEAVLIALVVHDPAKAEPDIEEVYLYDAERRWPGERYPLQKGGFTRYIITSNQAMLIENFNDPHIMQQTGATDWGDVTDRPLAAAAVPLRLGENVIGMLSVQSNAPHRYTAEDQNLLEMLAAYSATAFEKARLFAQVQRHVTDLEERVAERTRELTVANDQLAAANTRLTELDRLKDQFISRISHELRTPLASIKIYLELLGQAVPEKRDKYLRTLQQETDRLHRLIEDLLNYTELKLVLAETDLKPIDLNQFASIIVQEYAPIAAQQGLSMTLDLEPGLPFVIGDSSLIRQIVVNLINNALNYSGSGIITVKTQAQTVADVPRITISVQDSGPGITPKDLPHLFERFYRGEAARNYKIPGTGLGLAIAHDIATALGGEITVESVPGKGATFTVWLRMMSDE